ncbi:MAG TPA: Hsp20/alpha crystallin family protein [Candidatus Dormibacteraeota bacterium]|nr:Hsp20/alpha crystallin family protein [Candidatus Dormibacteraeota bacterium]
MDFVIRSRTVAFEPNADVFVDDARSSVVVTVEVAGANPESLRVEIDDERHLVISGDRPRETRSASGSFVQKEISYGEFSKRIHLPVAVEYDGAAATYGDGVLAIALRISQTAYRPTERTEIRMIVKRVPF